MKTVVSASAICSTVMWKQNSGGVSASKRRVELGDQRAHVVLQRALNGDRIAIALLHHLRNQEIVAVARRRIGEDVVGLAAVGDDVVALLHRHRQ